MNVLFRLTSIVLAGALIGAGPTASASATGAPPETTPTEHFVTLTVERFDAANHPLSKEVLAGDDGLGVDESGSGGTPSGSGCAKVTVNNYERSVIFHVILFGYHTWTYWCWNRAGYSVSNISTGFYVSHVDPTWEWVGEVTRDLHYYDWAQGHGYSGYWHYRQGHFQQCSPWTCVHQYPSNTLRSHSDGTWTWSTT